MDRSNLTRIAIIAAIVAGVSLLIAGMIGVASGAFRSMATGTFRFSGPGRAGSAAIDERKSLPIAGISQIEIKAVSEDIAVREVSGDDITARFHGNVGPASAADRPHLQVTQQGDAAEIRIERREHVSFGSTYSDAVLEVGIPKKYAGRLSAESVSADITLGSHSYTEFALTTVSGDIEAQAVRVTGSVNANSTSGDVALAFAKMPGSIAVETVSGDVRLVMPYDARFTLDAHAISGDVNCDLPITLAGSHADGGEHGLAGTVGSGGGNVTARAVSGDIEITRNGGK